MIVTNTPTPAIRGFYEPQDLPYGTAYVWHPLPPAGVIEEDGEEEARIKTQSVDEVLHPWRYRPEHDGEDKLPY